MLLQIGDKAPDFTLLTDEGKSICLSQLLGKKVVLYFYPKDHTPGCTKEACAFRDAFENFKKFNTEIFGISKDNAKTHASFKQKHSLPFTLLVDPHGDVCQTYGVLNKKSLFGKTFLGIQRSTFLIDEKGMVQALWRKVKVTHHVEHVLHELK